MIDINLEAGYENISYQKDTDFLQEVNILTSSVTEDINTAVVTSKSDRKLSDFKSMLGNKLILAKYKSIFAEVESILSKRFNYKVKIVVSNKSDTTVYSNYLNTSYSNVTKALKEIDKKIVIDKDLLKDSTIEKLQDQASDGLNNILTSLQEDYIEIDKSTGKIYGMENTLLNIFVNPALVGFYNLSGPELTSLLLREIGVFYTNASMMSETSFNNIDLLDKFLNNTSNKSTNEKIKIVLEENLDTKTKETDNIKIMREFNSGYIKDLETRLEQTRDIEAVLLKYVTNFGLGLEYGKAITKIELQAKDRLSDFNISRNTVTLLIYFVIGAIIAAILMMINIVMGVMALIQLTVTLGLMLAQIAIKTAGNVFVLIFNVVFNGDSKDTVTLIKSLKTIKKTLIQELRTTDTTNKNMLTLQIAEINSLMKRIDKDLANENLIRKQHKIDTNVWEWIDSLQENNLHYLSQSLKK